MSLTQEARLDFPSKHQALVAAMADAVEALAGLDHDVGLVRHLIDQAIWNVTEFKRSSRQKYGGLRWRSRAAHAAASPPWRDLRHEHPVERDWLLRLLAATPSAAHTALWNLPAALVTKDEHRLMPSGSTWRGSWGWAKYVATGIEIIDAGNGQAVDLQAMNERLRACYEPLVNAAVAGGARL